MYVVCFCKQYLIYKHKLGSSVSKVMDDSFVHTQCQCRSITSNVSSKRIWCINQWKSICKGVATQLCLLSSRYIYIYIYIYTLIVEDLLSYIVPVLLNLYDSSTKERTVFSSKSTNTAQLKFHDLISVSISISGSQIPFYC